MRTRSLTATCRDHASQPGIYLRLRLDAGWRVLIPSVANLQAFILCNCVTLFIILNIPDKQAHSFVTV